MRITINGELSVSTQVKIISFMQTGWGVAQPVFYGLGYLTVLPVGSCWGVSGHWQNGHPVPGLHFVTNSANTPSQALGPISWVPPRSGVLKRILAGGVRGADPGHAG